MNTHICDVCRESGKPVTTYTVTQGDRQRDTHRCEDHGFALEAILAGEHATTSARPARRGGHPRPRIQTLEEIEARKAGLRQR